MPSETLILDPDFSPVDLASGADGFYLRGFESPPPARKMVTASSQDTEGSLIVDSEYDSRVLTVVIRATAEDDRSDWYAKLDKLQQKVGKINTQGGVLKRVLIGATTPGYYDLIGDAQGDIAWDTARYAKIGDIDITLKFLAKPFIRGDEIALGDNVETTLPCIIVTETALAGDVSGLGRLVVDNDSTADQLYAWWGSESYFGVAPATAAMFYEAEALTPLDQAATYAIGSASGAGNNSMRHPSPSTTVWTPILLTDIAGVGKMTHKGLYRVIARAYSVFTNASLKPQIRFLWGKGDFTSSMINQVATIPVTATWYLLDLGLVRLDAAQWAGAIQGKVGTSGDTAPLPK